MLKNIYFAICYDFDGTLSPFNMQESDFLPRLNIKPDDFWKEVDDKVKENKADPILMYMKLMLDKTHGTKVEIRKRSFIEYGKNIKFYKGLEAWFDRINQYGNEKNIKIEHYIISSGIKEIIEGTIIKKKFKEIFASSFIYDQNDVAVWPAVAVNYTTKTQFLFRINKGVNDITDNQSINNYYSDEDRRIPFSRIIYIGDGRSDVPCMKLVKVNNGNSIAVFTPSDRNKKKVSELLLKENRVNFIAEADYTENSRLDLIVKAIVDNTSTIIHLSSFEK